MSCENCGESVSEGAQLCNYCIQDAAGWTDEVSGDENELGGDCLSCGDLFITTNPEATMCNDCVADHCEL